MDFEDVVDPVLNLEQFTEDDLLDLGLWGGKDIEGRTEAIPVCFVLFTPLTIYFCILSASTQVLLMYYI